MSDADQAEVEKPQEKHDDHVGGARQEDDESEAATSYSETVKQQVEVVIVRLRQPEQCRHLSQSVRQRGEPVSHYSNTNI